MINWIEKKSAQIPRKVAVKEPTFTICRESSNSANLAQFSVGRETRDRLKESGLIRPNDIAPKFDVGLDEEGTLYLKRGNLLTSRNREAGRGTGMYGASNSLRRVITDFFNTKEKVTFKLVKAGDEVAIFERMI